MPSGPWITSSVFTMHITEPLASAHDPDRRSATRTHVGTALVRHSVFTKFVECTWPA